MYGGFIMGVERVCAERLLQQGYYNHIKTTTYNMRYIKSLFH